MTQLRVALWLAVSSEAQAKPDKVSLLEQERVGRAWVEAQPGAKLVKVFHWDGYSRSETDVLTAYEDFAAQGRHEYHELRQMWQQRAFDVLWVYVHDRIARSTALYAQVVGNVIKSGARIYSHTDGWIDEHNVDAFMAIGGFSTSNDIRKLKERRAMGMRQRLALGKSTTSGVLFTHIRQRDPASGKELRLVVDESRRRLFDDAAHLVLEGVGWFALSKALYEQYGHITDSGKPYSPSRIYGMMMNPITWGHNARRFRSADKGRSWAKFGEWIFEPGHEIPPGVEIEYNTIPPVYTGDLAERLKTEIRYRMASVRGHTASKDKFWFTNLIVCDECGYYMTAYTSNPNRPRLKCKTHWIQSHARRDCSQRASVMSDYLKEWFNERLTQLLVVGGYSLAADEDGEPTTEGDALRQEIDALTKQIRTMIRKQSMAVDDAADLYDAEIDEATKILNIRKARLAEVEQLVYISSSRHREQIRAVEVIREHGLHWFWEQDAPFIRNTLLSILGGSRLSARDGAICQIVPAPRS